MKHNMFSYVFWHRAQTSQHHGLTFSGYDDISGNGELYVPLESTINLLVNIAIYANVNLQSLYQRFISNLLSRVAGLKVLGLEVIIPFYIQPPE